MINYLHSSPILIHMPVKVKMEEIMEPLMDQKIVDSIAAKTSTDTDRMIDELFTKACESYLRSFKDLKRENQQLKAAVYKLSLL